MWEAGYIPVESGRMGRMSQVTTKADKPNVFTRVGRYFGDVRTELKRVVWPQPTEVKNATVVVVMTLFAFVFFVLIVDQISSSAFIGLRSLVGR